MPFCKVYIVDLVSEFNVTFAKRNTEFRNSNVREQDVKARNVGRV